jgi:hypothetical protein
MKSLWSKVPKEFIYMSQDRNGDVYAYKVKPYTDEEERGWSVDPFDRDNFEFIDNLGEYNENWRETLIGRTEIPDSYKKKVMEIL